ncbi:hypothetical protein LCI18_014064 [Fusarium solani-melongenae]|uniref:Uncharacterized protein n=1 Tax=Fusarium solani subsp. cucurbitae TaxID=2747967 RepID=A0ACD3ZPB5_FUSSC|nr:hypothetical protein LCI18_014064 [Fusarium solani-melongenae]
MSTFRLDALLDPSDDDVKKTFNENESKYHDEFLTWYHTNQDKYCQVVHNPDELSKFLDDAFPEPEKRHCFFYWYEKWVGRMFLAHALPIEPKQLINAVAATNFLVQRDAGKISSLMQKFTQMPVLLGEGEFDGQTTGFAFIAAQNFLWPDVQKPDWLVAEPSLLAINLNERPETSQSHPTIAHLATNNKGHPRPNMSGSSAESGTSADTGSSGATADTSIMNTADYGNIIPSFTFVQLGALRYFEGDWNNIRDKDETQYGVVVQLTERGQAGPVWIIYNRWEPREDDIDEYDSETDEDDVEVRDPRILAKGRAGHLNDEKDNAGSPVHIANINCDPKNKLNFGVCVDHPCKIMRIKRCFPSGGEEELLVADP